MSEMSDDGIRQKAIQVSRGQLDALPLAVYETLDKFSPFKDVHVDGEENLEQIPEGQAVIFAVSHNGSQDFNVVIPRIGNKFDVVVTDISTHDDPRQEFGSWLGKKLIRIKTLPVTYGWNAGQRKQPLFNPGDADAMEEAAESGKSLLIAAYNPVIKEEDGSVREPTPGYMAGYLALRSGLPVVPIAVDAILRGDGKYDAAMHIGAPFSIDKAEFDDETFRQLYAQREGGTLPPESRARFVDMLRAVRASGEEVFSKVRSLQESPNTYPFAEVHRKVTGRLGGRGIKG